MGADTALSETVKGMVFFALVSNSLLIVNKLCLQRIPAPSVISAMQFGCSASFVIFLQATGLAPVDVFEWPKVQAYLLYVTLFCLSIYLNMKTMTHANIETVVTFRACAPLVVNVLDWAFMGREPPRLRSAIALFVISVGAATYVFTDRAFGLSGWSAYTWASCYLGIISIEITYAKHIVGPSLKWSSMWGPTLYTNALSILPMSIMAYVSGEHRVAASAEWDRTAIGLVGVSCALGVAMSFAGFRMANLLSATGFAVFGVSNKMIVTMCSVLFLDQHASPLGVCALVVCLVGAACYKQAPERGDASKCTATGLRRSMTPVVGALLAIVVLRQLANHGVIGPGSAQIRDRPLERAAGGSQLLSRILGSSAGSKLPTARVKGAGHRHVHREHMYTRPSALHAALSTCMDTDAISVIVQPHSGLGAVTGNPRGSLARMLCCLAQQPDVNNVLDAFMGKGMTAATLGGCMERAGKRHWHISGFEMDPPTASRALSIMARSGLDVKVLPCGSKLLLQPQHCNLEDIKRPRSATVIQGRLDVYSVQRLCAHSAPDVVIIDPISSAPNEIWAIHSERASLY